MLGRTTATFYSAGTEMCFQGLPQDVQHYQEFGHCGDMRVSSCSPCLERLELIWMKDARVCAVWLCSSRKEEDCCWAGGVGVQPFCPSKEACSHAAGAAEARLCPHGMGMLQLCGMCNCICGTAAKLGCCWLRWGGKNIWERPALRWEESWGRPVVFPPCLACPTPSAALRWQAPGLDGLLATS